MEPKELSPAMLQPQVTVVAILGELLDTVPTQEEETLLESSKRLHRGLEEFTKEVQVTLRCIDDNWRRHIVTSDDGGGVTSLSQALAAYGSTPQSTQDCVAMAASEWQWSVSVLLDRWAQLVRKATELRDTWSKVATDAMTAEFRELQEKGAQYGIAIGHMVELGLAMGRGEGVKMSAMTEFPEAVVATSEAIVNTMGRQWVWRALGLLERLVAACDEAAAFPRELQRLLGDTETALKGTKKKSPDVPEDLVAKVAMAERLWEANARLARNHLVGIIDDILDYYSNGGRSRPSVRGVPRRCQRAIKDISRLLRPPERPQCVPKASPVSMEVPELSKALLQPQVTVVAILGELLDTLPRRDEEMLLLESPKHLHRDLKEFTEDLQATLRCIENTRRRRIISSDDDDGGVTSLSQALAAHRSTPQTTQGRVAMAASEWQWSVNALVDSWARLTRKATELRDTCRVATEALTTRARELQAQAARDGTALERMGELGQALGGEEGAEVAARTESPMREEAMVAAREATRVGQWLEAALGLLERLVAACDEATAFPRELQRLLRDTKTALEGTKKKFDDVPEYLVAKVAEAERLWEANAHLAKDHLVGAVDDFLDYYFIGGRAGLSPCGVAERCQRAIEDIQRLLQPPEHPQGVPKGSPVSMEPQELSPALLQPQVTVVATLGELLDTLPTQEEMMLESPKHLHRDLEEFTKELWVTLQCIENTRRRHIVPNDDDGGVTSLSRALAAHRSTPQTTQGRVAMVASEWQWSVNVLVDRWARLTRKATELRDTWSKVATEALTTRARERQDEAARDGTALEHRVELGQALGGEEGAEVAARTESSVREEAMVAASEATRATMVRLRVWAALGLLQCLVAACDEATAFPRELQRLLRDIEAALKGTKKKFDDVPEDLVAKVAEAERLWEANAHLAKDHLVGAVDDFLDYYSKGGRARPSARGVAKRCQRAIKDISRLLRPPERPQCIPKLSQLSPTPLQAQVTVVAILGELLGTLPMQEEETLLESPKRLHRGLKEFTKELRATLCCIDDTWRRRIVTDDDDGGVTSLSQALAAYRSTPGTSRDDVARAASEWQWSVAVLVNSWAQMARKATELHNTCRDLATKAADEARELQAQAARDGTALERMGELGQALGREQGAEGVARTESSVREEAMEAASEATRATMVTQRVWAALGLLERLVAACDEATAFPRELERLLGDTRTALEGTNEAFPTVPDALVAKVAEAERLWEANTRLAKDHLLGIIDDILDYYSKSGCARPSAREVAERCQRATEDIPNLLQDDDVTAMTS